MKARVLYIGNLREGGNGRDRMRILNAQGYETEGFDTRPYRDAGPRLLRSLTARGLGPAVWALNRALVARAQKGGFDLVMVDKGTVIRSLTLRTLKAFASKHIAVHYTPDAAFVDNRSRAFFRAIPDYDLLVTTKPFEMDCYRDGGARDLLLIHQGYGPRIDPSLASEVPRSMRSEAVFVGHCQPHYARLLRVAAGVVPLTIWGPGWPEYAEKNQWAEKCVRGAGIYGADYARILGGAKIAIGLLSKRVPETTTTRSFEIPAIGTMLLAERTPDHQALFEEGSEAEFFNTPDELATKLRHYIADDVSRERVAAAGQARCMISGYATAEQFSRITDWLDKALKSSKYGDMP